MDYQEYDKQIPKIMEKVKCLLNCHQIQSVRYITTSSIYTMKEENDDRVHYYKFQKIEEQQVIHLMLVPVRYIGGVALALCLTLYSFRQSSHMM